MQRKYSIKGVSLLNELDLTIWVKFFNGRNKYTMHINFVFLGRRWGRNMMVLFSMSQRQDTPRRELTLTNIQIKSCNDKSFTKGHNAGPLIRRLRHLQCIWSSMCDELKTFNSYSITIIVCNAGQWQSDNKFLTYTKVLVEVVESWYLDCNMINNYD